MRSKVALVKGADRKDNILRALELIREDVVARTDGLDVMVKPNCLKSSVPISCTHADALRGILEFLAGLSPKSVTVAEGCKGSEHFESYRTLGYTAFPEDFGASLIDLEEENDWTELYLLNKDYEEVKVSVSRAMVNSKCRISAPVAKTHDAVTFTASWKNMMGALTLMDKVKMHGVNSHSERVLTSEIAILPQNLVRIAKCIPPHIGVIDGFLGMEGNGPVGGSEKYLGIAIASTDFVAADAVCAKAMGFEPMEISYLYYGHRLGLGTAELGDLEIVGNSIEEVAGKFKPHTNYPTQRLWRKYAPEFPQ